MSSHTSSSKDEFERIKQQLVQRNAELLILNSIQQGLASRLKVQAIYDLVGDKIRDIFNSQVVMISTYDPQTETIEHRYAIEQGERVYAPGKFPVRGFRTQIVQTQKPVLVSKNVAEQAALLGQPTLPGTITPKTWLGVPMLVGDQVTGILSLQNVEHENAFSEEDVRLLQTVAASMSVALENARLFDETQRLLHESEQRAQELEIINNVQQGLAQRLDTFSICELVGDRIRDIFQQADIFIGIYQPETDLLTASYLIESGNRIAFEPYKVDGKGFIGHLLHNPQPILINANMQEAVIQYQGKDATGAGIPKSALYVPLTMGGSVRGEIVLENKYEEYAFSKADQHLLQTLANAMSVALENARLWDQEKKYLMAMEHEFEIGREIQAGFLPKQLPQPSGWEIAAMLLPAREVAGDFYDVFELPQGRIGLVIADVCDKGLGAALFMTLFRSFLRAASNIDFYAQGDASSGNSSAERIKNAILLTNNYIVNNHGNTGMFATIFFGILDTQTGILTYINGGHIPPVLLNQQEAKNFLTLTGPAVGGNPNAEYKLKEIAFEPEDILFAYTDGITDTTNPDGEYLNERELFPLFGKGQALSKVLDKVIRRIEDFSQGATRVDDITLLAIKRQKR